MNPGVASQPINQNNDDVCEVCFEQKPVYISLITCTHRNTFCEECIKSWLLWRNFTCPKCREVWSVNDYLEITNQTHLNMANVSLTVEHHSPPPSTTGGLMYNVLVCCSIGLLLGLIIYPATKQL